MSDNLYMMRAVITLCTILCIGLAALAAPPILVDKTPSNLDSASPANSRIIKTYDFEETALGNFDTVPMFWSKVIGRGYPLYTTGKFDKTVYRSKATSFKMELDGGSVAYQLTPGKLSAGSGADYYITGFVKTTALPNARAQITGWFADAAGKMISGTQANSEAWASPDGKDDWHVLQLYLPGCKAGAHSIVLQMGLLQPQQLCDRQLGEFELYAQDIHGTAWFDDISVFQLPRVAINTPAPANVFASHQPVQIDISVSDLGRGRLDAQVNILDRAGAAVSSEKYEVQPLADAPWSHTLKLGAGQLPQGAYTAQLEVIQAKEVLARRQLHFLVCPPIPPGQGPAADFGLAATDWPVEAWPQLLPLVQASGVGLLKLPAWRQEMSDNSLLRRDPPFESLVAGLEKNGVLPLACFSQVPATLAAKLHEQSISVLGLFDSDPAIWRPYVSFVLARYASRVSYWEIGQERDPFSTSDPRYARVYGKVQAELAGLLNQPKLVIPWNVQYDFEPKNFPNAMLDLRIPATIKVQEIPTYIGNFTQHNVPVQVLIDPPDAGLNRTGRIADFAQRIVLARYSKPLTVLIDMPIAHQAALTGLTFDPSELFLIYGTLVRNLGGKTPRQEIIPEPGIHGYLFDNNGEGTLVLWSDDAAAHTVNLALGQNPVQHDLFGHAAPIVPVEGIAKLTVSNMPILIDHVDAGLLKLRGSFAVGAAILPAGNGIARTTIKLSNPYDKPMVGKLRLTPPEGWTLDTPTIDVQLAPGETMDAPVTIRYPFTEFAGVKTLSGKLAVDGTDRPLDIATQLTVTSGTVDVQCKAQVMPNGDLVLQQIINNISSTVLSAQAYAMIPGAARQECFVLNLPPGQTVIKRFTFPNVGPQPGKVGVLGLRQTTGRVLITKSVPLD